MNQKKRLSLVWRLMAVALLCAYNLKSKAYPLPEQRISNRTSHHEPDSKDALELQDNFQFSIGLLGPCFGDLSVFGDYAITPDLSLGLQFNGARVKSSQAESKILGLVYHIKYYGDSFHAAHSDIYGLSFGLQNLALHGFYDELTSIKTGYAVSTTVSYGGHFLLGRRFVASYALGVSYVHLEMDCRDEMQVLDFLDEYHWSKTELEPLADLSLGIRF